MQAKVARTLEEPRGGNPGPWADRVRLLVRVLCFDDLLADCTAVYPLLGVPLPLGIGRADEQAGEGISAEARTGAELRLYDRFLSGNHAVLLSHDGTDVLRDLRSRNGTYINGDRIDERPLQDGDMIEIGISLLCYRILAERTFTELSAGLTEGVRIGPTRTFCGEMAAQVRDLRRIAPSSESVLLLSETGTGKEVAAQMVHALSGRDGPCQTVDAGAVPESLFESVFFGHRRGAFTGAATDQTGHLLRAHRGTLFLDEVANMSLASQAKLLRVIEDGKVTPLGQSTPSVPVDVRWVAATNINIFSEEVPFRRDLLRRLSGYVARLPPLRRRREDLGVLIAHFLRETGVGRATITTQAARRLFNDRFAGNVRQLRGLLRSAVLLAPDGIIDLPHLSSLYAAGPRARSVPQAMPQPGERADAPEPGRRPPPSPEEIDRALLATRGNVVRAAQRLDLHPRQLYRFIERLAMDLRHYRDG